MGPDLDLNKDEVEMVVLKRLWPCPAGTDLAGGGFRDSISTTNVYKTIPVLYYLDKKLRIICFPKRKRKKTASPFSFPAPQKHF